MAEIIDFKKTAENFKKKNRQKSQEQIRLENKYMTQIVDIKKNLSDTESKEFNEKMEIVLQLAEMTEDVKGIVTDYLIKNADKSGGSFTDQVFCRVSMSLLLLVLQMRNRGAELFGEDFGHIFDMEFQHIVDTHDNKNLQK